MSLGPAYFGSVPSFVLDYAPLIHLHSDESHWPASLYEHIDNSFLRGPNLQHFDFPQRDPFSLLTRQDLNSEKSYITAKQDVPADPLQSWLRSKGGKPGSDGKSTISPAIMILVDKSSITGVPHTLDAFWFTWYSLNWAPSTAGIQDGNSVGDWEHCMVRFKKRKPKAVHLSAGLDGAAYTYKCLEKDGARPVVYSAVGTHALYPKAGTYGHEHTNHGPLWDPALNFAAFEYIPTAAQEFVAIHPKDNALLPCLEFRGRWGDHFSDPDVRWWDGPTGPKDKNLDRRGMNRSDNIINKSI